MSKSRLMLCALFVTLCLSTLHAAPPPAIPQQVAELTPSQRANNDWFGYSIAISGNTVVVGAFDANIEKFGTVYVYVKPDNGWTDMTQVAILTSSDSGEGFGTSVAISGNTIVVGAANTSNFEAPTATPGAAYVFVRPAGGWADMTETAKLTASDGQPGDAFGNSVSIEGNTIAVGAFFATDAANNSFAGKAYVFVRPNSGWTGNLNQTAILTASDSQLLNYMGASIATNGNTVVVGAYGHNNFQGAAYVFVKSPTGWTSITETAQLTASDGKGSSDFAFSTSMSGDTVVFGTPGAAQFKGAAYIFVKPPTGWTTMTETAKLHAANAIQGDSFGQSAGISGNIVVIGAPGAVVGANQGQGAAYVFTKPKNGWRNSSKATQLTANDGAPNDNLGLSAAISRNTIVTGATASNAPGKAYVFAP